MVILYQDNNDYANKIDLTPISPNFWKFFVIASVGGVPGVLGGSYRIASTIHSLAPSPVRQYEPLTLYISQER
jgi:hypothetical protein